MEEALVEPSRSKARRKKTAQGGSEARGRILDFAKDLFFAQGFSGVTMDELAHRLRMSKKTLYCNFKSKNEIIDAVMERHFFTIKGRLESVLSRPSDFIERLYSYCSIVTDTLSRLSPQLREDLRVRRPDLWRKVEEYRRRRILSDFSRFMEEGISIGVIRPEIDKEIAILVFLSAVQGIINPQTLSERRFSAESAFSGIVEVVFEGILTPAAVPGYRKRFKTSVKGKMS